MGFRERATQFVVGHWLEAAILGGLAVLFQLTDLGNQVLAGTVGAAPEPVVTFTRMCGQLLRAAVPGQPPGP